MDTMGINEVDITERIIVDRIRKIPISMWVSIITTFAIGLIAHGMVYGNFLYWGDGLLIYNTDRLLSISSAAVGFRWIQGFATYLFQHSIPWVGGIYLLLAFGIGSWLSAQAVGIKTNFKVVLFAGIMITSYTVISISSCPGIGFFVFGSCYLFSSLAAFLHNYRGWIFTVAFCGSLFISVGLYPAYISWTVSLILINSLIKLIHGGDIKEEILTQIKYFLFAFLVLVADIALCIIIVNRGQIYSALSNRGNNIEYSSMADEETTESKDDIIIENMDYRLAGAVSDSKLNIVKKMIRSNNQTKKFFLPGNEKESYFRDNMAYYSFFFGFVFTILIVVKRMISSRRIKQVGLMLLIVFDFYVWTYSINIIGMIENSHELMRIAFMTPWLFMICMLDQKGVRDDTLERMYHILVVVVLGVQIIWGCYLANICYTKEKVIYEGQLQLASRIIDRVEKVEGYVPGETQVVFLGKLKSYARHIDAFSVTDTLFGYTADANDSAVLDSGFYYLIVMQQHLNNKIKARWIGNERELDSDDTIKGAILYEMQGMESFPSENCIKWVGDNVLLFKCSELE